MMKKLAFRPAALDSLESRVALSTLVAAPTAHVHHVSHGDGTGTIQTVPMPSHHSHHKLDISKFFRRAFDFHHHNHNDPN